MRIKFVVLRLIRIEHFNNSCVLFNPRLRFFWLLLSRILPLYRFERQDACGSTPGLISSEYHNRLPHFSSQIFFNLNIIISVVDTDPLSIIIPKNILNSYPTMSIFCRHRGEIGPILFVRPLTFLKIIAMNLFPVGVACGGCERY